MTDNRTTELREKLTERGVEFATDDSAASKVTMWTTHNGGWMFDCDYMEPLNEKPGTIGAKTELMIYGYTPEQAIAATFGNGTLTAEQVRECVQHVYHEGYSDGSVRRGAHIDETDWQAIADELNAHVGRTCKPSWVLQGETQTQEFWRCECGNCGECFGVEDRSSFPFKMTIDKVEIPNFCQKCGCKVVDE